MCCCCVLLHSYGGFAPIAAALVYIDTGLIGLSPYPNDPTQTDYTKLSRKCHDCAVCVQQSACLPCLATLTGNEMK